MIRRDIPVRPNYTGDGSVNLTERTLRGGDIASAAERIWELRRLYPCDFCTLTSLSRAFTFKGKPGYAPILQWLIVL